MLAAQFNTIWQFYIKSTLSFSDNPTLSLCKSPCLHNYHDYIGLTFFSIKLSNSFPCCALIRSKHGELTISFLNLSNKFDPCLPLISTYTKSTSGKLYRIFYNKTLPRNPVVPVTSNLLPA